MASNCDVDLGVIGGQTFVNNASFGAYAAVVESPAYRGDKLNTTLKLLPDLLQGHRGARLSARADGVEIRAPQALLVANNPYGTGDIAGLSRRARLDRGILGVVGVRVRSAQQAVGLLRGARATGLSVLAAKEIGSSPTPRTSRSASTVSRSRCRHRCTARSIPARSACGCHETAPASPGRSPR